MKKNHYIRATLLIILFLIFISFLPRSAHARTAAEWRSMADDYIAKGQYEQAAEAYREAAVIYRKIGDVNGAKVLETYADRYETKVTLFYSRPAKYDNVKKYYTNKRLEPVYGTYIGAFIDREDKIIENYNDENWQMHKDSGEFNKITERNHAVFFMYLKYGQEFPQAWTDHLKEHGAAAQFAIEPDSLGEIKDNKWLRNFAHKTGESGIPVFMRFAGEMNGDWTPYHGDPAEYIKKFRLVADVFHKEAPNVAMVWCVNDIPEHEITKYYPGEAYVDWVGVNFYSVLFNDNDPKRPAEWKNPSDSLKFVYNTYSSTHPIMICEFAASHKSRVDMKKTPESAIVKMYQLYSAIPRLYPRVKAVHWLSMDTMKYAIPGRQLNDYSLLDDPSVAEAYKDVVSSRYFLDNVSLDKPAMAEEEIVALKDGESLSGKVTISCYVKTYENIPEVAYYIGGKEVKSFDKPGYYNWLWDTKSLSNGKTQVKVVVSDKKGNTAGTYAVTVQIKN